MALFFTIAGLVLIVTGANGTIARAGQLLKDDFTGPGNFVTWVIAIVLVGALGYAPKLRPLSYMLLALVFVIILLTSGSGVFDRLQNAIANFTKYGVDVGGSSSKSGGSFFGVDIPFLKGGTEGNLEDKAIDVVGEYFGGDYYRFADKFI